MSGVYESTIKKAWEHPREDTGKLVCFTLDEIPDHAFVGASDWLPLLEEARSLRTRVRVMFSKPEIVKCADPHCGDGCCKDEECTNVPEEERSRRFTLRADTLEWL